MKRLSLILLIVVWLFSWVGAQIHTKASAQIQNQDVQPVQPIKYNLYCTLQGDAKGKILLVFSYRLYYEATASVDLIYEKKDNYWSEFYLDTVKQAFVARTLDFGGKKMCIMNADYDYAHNMRFAQEKEIYYRNALPYYSKYVTSCNLYPYEIISQGKAGLRFYRGINGILKDVVVDFKLLRKFNNPKFDTYFHIDRIMTEILKIYNHSTLPAPKLEDLPLYKGKEWYSKQLDYSFTMNEISRLISTFTEKHVRFKQSNPFQLKYRIVPDKETVIHIWGETYPDIKIWSDWNIKRVTRSTKYSTSDYTLLVDELIADIRSDKGNGGLLIIRLKKID